MLWIHTALRDRYAKRALCVDVALLACSVVFCATTFVDDSFFKNFAQSPSVGRLIMGCASVIAFLASLVSLRVDWKGCSARHQDAAAKLSQLSAAYRKARPDEGEWPADSRSELHDLYWSTTDAIVDIPAGLFVPMKIAYLRNVETSKFADLHPGCPYWILKSLVLLRSLAFSRRSPATNRGDTPNEDSPKSTPTD